MADFSILVHRCVAFTMARVSAGPTTSAGATAARPMAHPMSRQRAMTFVRLCALSLGLAAGLPHFAKADQDLVAPAAQPRDRFGSAVALGEGLLAASITHREPGLKGVVAFFSCGSDGQWVPATVITSGTNDFGDELGASVAIDGELVVVGAPGFKQWFLAASQSMRGRVIILRRMGDGTLTQLHIDPSSVDNGRYGSAVAISGEWVIAGRPGASSSAVRFLRVIGDLVTPLPWTTVPGAGSGALGNAVAISGAWAASSGLNYESVGISGVVRLFKRVGRDAWQPAHVIVHPESIGSDRFGLSIAMHGDVLVVGAPGSAQPNELGRGAAFVYRRDGDVWQLEAELAAPIDGFCEGFGRAVAVQGSRVVIGAVEVEDQSMMGSAAVFMFERQESAWQHTTTRTASAVSDFGAALALHGGTLVIGVPGFSQSGDGERTEWSFEGRVEVEGLVTADLDGDGIVDGADIAYLLGAWGPVAPGAPADLNDDGMVDGADLVILLSNWS